MMEGSHFDRESGLVFKYAPKLDDVKCGRWESAMWMTGEIVGPKNLRTLSLAKRCRALGIDVDTPTPVYEDGEGGDMIYHESVVEGVFDRNRAELEALCAKLYGYDDVRVVRFLRVPVSPTKGDELDTYGVFVEVRCFMNHVSLEVVSDKVLQGLPDFLSKKARETLAKHGELSYDLDRHERRRRLFKEAVAAGLNPRYREVEEEASEDE